MEVYTNHYFILDKPGSRVILCSNMPCNHIINISLKLLINSSYQESSFHFLIFQATKTPIAVIPPTMLIIRINGLKSGGISSSKKKYSY